VSPCLDGNDVNGGWKLGEAAAHIPPIVTTPLRALMPEIWPGIDSSENSLTNAPVSDCEADPEDGDAMWTQTDIFFDGNDH